MDRWPRHLHGIKTVVQHEALDPAEAIGAPNVYDLARRGGWVGADRFEHLQGHVSQEERLVLDRGHEYVAEPLEDEGA